MQKLEVLIEENAFGSVRPVEVVADAPVSALVPALVEELKLPQTDLFGKKLVYMLRHSAGGRILPEHSTLLASGVESGARLALDSYVLDGTVATLVQQNLPNVASPDPVLHSSATLADADSFAPLNVRNTTGNLPHIEEKSRKWPRRAFLLFGTAVLGAGGAGVAYAAYRGYTISDLLHTNNAKTNPVPQAVPPQTKPTTPPKPAIPTKAQAVFTFTQHKQIVRSVVWSADGTLLASGADDAHVFIWSPNGTVQHDIPHPASVQSLAWSLDRQRLVTGSQNQVAFYSVQNATRIALHHHAKAVTSVAWAAHNQMLAVSAGQDDLAFVWNTNNYLRQSTFKRHTTAILAVSWSADGQTIASGTQGGIIRVWQGNNAQELHGGYDIKVSVRALAFAPTGTQLAVGGNDGMVRIWNGVTCQQQANATIANQCIDAPLLLQASNTPVRAVSWSPDGRFLAVGTNDGQVTVWYPAQNQQKPILTAKQNSTVRSLTWSPQGDQLASGSGNTVTIWKLM
jgi:Tol biopolymer transport system component